MSDDDLAGTGPRAWPDRPVLVLGAGPVGQTTALLLARWGVPTIVVDQRPERDKVGSKAICQQRDVLDVWEAVGAGRRIAAEGVTWTTARTFHRGAELFAIEFAEAGRPAFPPFVNISQTRTEEILDERIADEPLVDLRWGHRAEGVEQDADGVSVHLAGGAEVRGSYLVVCTGAASTELRSALGVSFAGHSFDDRFLICDIRAELPGWAGERRFYFDPAWNPGRQVLIHPCPGSTFRIDWQVPAGYDLDAEVASGALDARIRQIVGDRDYEIVWKSVYRFHSRVADRMRAGRVLLAGDAAHLVSPFGARGLNSGVADAENAAWKIAYVGYGWSGEELLESYHRERHAAAVENIAVTTATMDFLVPPDESRARRRAALLAAAADDPVARGRVDSGRLAEPFWYVESPLTTADARRPFAGRPPRGQVPPAAPGVLLPDAPVVVPGRGPARARELARDGFLLLSCGAADHTAVAAAAAAAPGPVRVLVLDEIDPSGTLTTALDAKAGEVWVVRPDAHVAAVVTGPEITRELSAALRRAAHTPPPRPPARPSPRRRTAMAYYRRVGDIPPKRHTQHRTGTAELRYEELMGEEGFSSDSALLYHVGIPSAIVDAAPWELPDQATTENRPLLPRHLQLHRLFGDGWKATDAVTGRRLVLGNADVRIGYVVAGEASPLYRNAVGDECVYVESGTARVETVFGVLDAVGGDYVLIPRATTHRWVPTGSDPLRLYAIEANSHIAPPARYLSRFGQLLEHAPYCERDLHGPGEPLLVEGSDVEVLVKHRGSRGIVGTRYVYPTHPFDVVGWDGCLYPYTFNISDFEPITGRVHQPPPVHQVFAGGNFVICNFVPRKVDYHPLSVPVPYYHSNVDSDEVMFYCGGDYEARKGSGIAQGSISLHPGGHSHGPQPGAVERSIGAEFFDELAVMVDTFRPLELGEGGRAADDPGYAWTWSGRGPSR